MKQDIVGKTSGKLTAIEECEYISKKGKVYPGVKCKCLCGNEKIVKKYEFNSEKVKSCGCLIGEFNRKTKTGNKYYLMKPNVMNHRPYAKRIRSIWKDMRGRCKNKVFKGYSSYGGRGIEVCKEWDESFENFYSWATSNGYADDLSIDRINVNGNYEPSNCRWATNEQQSRNTRVNNNITINGVTHCITDWSRITGVSARTFNRICMK